MAEDKDKSKNIEEKDGQPVIKEVAVHPENAKGEKGAEKQVPEDPYLEMEFEGFLNLIGEANLLNWSIIAEALNVHRNTISRWKKTPEARQAIKTAIAQNLQEMEIAGKGDWKMNREKLKMLGVNEKQVIENRNIDVSDSLQSIAEALQGIYDQEDEK
jgi:hypothetical protein